MLSLIDKLAGKWLDWRTENFAKCDPELSEMHLHSIEIKNGGMEAAIISPAVAHLADMMSELLENNRAENFVSFELLPRLDRGKRPILVTVQWHNGKSPAQARDELILAAREAIDYFERNTLNFQYEKMQSYLFNLKLLAYPAGGTTPLAHDAGESAVSTSSFHASAESTSQNDTAPTQRV